MCGAGWETMKAVGGGSHNSVEEERKHRLKEGTAIHKQATDTRLSHKHGERASPFPSRRSAPEWDHANVTKQKS